ncbi:Aste57867_21202 [Aphanomyces stellatus]|uniref:Aste57867_21202 protein n=1 Tax=Aphanomyces stellatus TaxID=120398 RepID=A0A485LGZ2_9STRA|nr:hypothetical protein As57867_021134 [Aphanomyces stellatus]VFT97875.1 Aste57867_21202 [Aphanomyces stellatus]
MGQPVLTMTLAMATMVPSSPHRRSDLQPQPQGVSTTKRQARLRLQRPWWPLLRICAKHDPPRRQVPQRPLGLGQGHQVDRLWLVQAERIRWKHNDGGRGDVSVDGTRDAALPKVLERVDVFSFGVLLAELSTHEIPYANMVSDEDTGRELSDEAITRRVIHEGLRPLFRDDCPPWLKALAV